MLVYILNGCRYSTLLTKSLSSYTVDSCKFLFHTKQDLLILIVRTFVFNEKLYRENKFVNVTRGCNKQNKFTASTRIQNVTHSS